MESHDGSEDHLASDDIPGVDGEDEDDAQSNTDSEELIVEMIVTWMTWVTLLVKLQTTLLVMVNNKYALYFSYAL